MGNYTAPNDDLNFRGEVTKERWGVELKNLTDCSKVLLQCRVITGKVIPQVDTAYGWELKRSSLGSKPDLVL